MREMMRALRLFLSGLGAGLTSLTQAVTFVNGFGMTDPEAYLAGFRRLAFFFAAFPLPLLLMGAFLANKWVIAAAGLLWAVETLILFLVISPLAYLITALLNKKTQRVVDPEMGRRYVTTALTVVFYELLISFFLFLTPIHRNPKILIILVMTATILALAGMTWLRKIMVGVALGTFAYYILALLAPGVAGELAEIPELAGVRAEKEIACVKDENSLKCREFQATKRASTGNQTATAVYVPDADMRHEGRFSLPARVVTQTVWVTAGTHHHLASNKPFVAISIEPDGKKIRWAMPAGKSVWNGGNPGGALLLEGVEAGTEVEIKKVR